MNTGNTTSTVYPAGASPISALQKLNLGALLVACATQAMLFGNALSLLWRYFKEGRAEDPRWYSTAIAFTGLLCTSSVFITSDALWFYVFGTLFRGSSNSPWTVDFFLLIIAMMAALVRVLYVYRLWRLLRIMDNFRGRILFLFTLISTPLLSMINLVAATVLCVRLYVANGASTSEDWHRVNRTLLYLAFATGISADIIVTGLMWTTIRNARREVYRVTNIVESLVVYTIQTALLPGLLEVAGMIAFVAMPTSKLFIVFFTQVGVLYLSSLLSSLNVGRFVKNHVQQPICVNFSVLDRVVVDPGPPTAEGTSFSTGPLTIEEDTHSVYLPGQLYRAEEKESTADIGQPHVQPEEEPLTYEASYITRPRAFTFPSLQRQLSA